MQAARNQLNLVLQRGVRFLEPRSRRRTSLNPYGLAVRILQRLEMATEVREGNMRRSTYGVWLLDREEDRTFRFAMRGAYGFEYSSYLEKIDRPFAFLDVGANIGLFSLVAARNPNCLMIHAFEPDPSSAAQLRENLSYANAVSCVHEHALSTKAGHAVLYGHRGHSGRSSLHPGGAATEQVTVSCVADPYLGTLDWNGALAIVTKVDVEGLELAVVEALDRAHLLERTISMYVEVDKETRQPIEARLGSAGLSTSKQPTERSRWDEFFVRRDSRPEG